VSIIIAARFFDLQIRHGSYYKAQAQSLHQTTKTLDVERGIIYFQDKNKTLIPVAINKKFYNVFAVPKDVKQKEEVAKILSPLLKINEQEILTRLNKPNDPYEPLANKVLDETVINEIKKQNGKDQILAGINVEEVNHRYYPLKNSASQVIGFVGYDEKDNLVGQYGLEKEYNAELAGKAGKFSGAKDAFGRLIRSIFSSEETSQQGMSLVSTIDKNINFKAEEELKQMVESRQAVGGSIVVMEPKTGKILALANYPDFDLNKYSDIKDISIFRNSVVEDRFELGSVMKIVTMAIGLETGALMPQTSYVDTGVVRVSGKDIKNFRNEVYGKADMTKVLEMSINTGAVYAQSLIGNENFRKYLKIFGMGEKTGVDLPDEVAGDLSNLDDNNAPQINFSTAAFGQGISMNPLVLLRAYAMVANKGKSVSPYVIEKFIDDKGNESSPNQSEPAQIISEKTAETLTSMMVKVVENGYGKNAAIKGYSIAGKTGTAQIPVKGGGYLQDDSIQTFYGFFPASDPKFVIAVKLDRPKLGAAAYNNVTYAFRDMAMYLINYYNIPPDNLTN